MKKKHRLLFLLVVTFFFNIQIANSATNNFGGIVTLAPSASQIILAESEGYFCPLVGKTFNIKPVKGPTGPYLVQAISLNGMLSNIQTGKQILGNYSSVKSKITCVNMKGLTKTINAYKVTLFGVSN